jgi:hypothetical protein
VGDFNHDDLSDLAVSGYGISVLLGNGNGTFQPARMVAAAAGFGRIAATDLNGDGEIDLVFSDAESNAVLICRGKGDGTFELEAVFGAGLGVGSAAPADFNHDGMMDLAVANGSSGTVSLLINDSKAHWTRVPSPTFDPPSGTFSQPQVVTIADSENGAVIHYTIDGSTPTTASPTYDGPIAVSKSMTIAAIVVRTGMLDSDVATAAYTLKAATPTFNPPGGAYLLPQFVTISSTSPGTTIYYTTNGSAPTTSSSRYTGAFLVGIGTTTVRAIAVAPGWSQSDVASATYAIPF